VSHPDLAEFYRIFPHVRELQVLASKHGIDDIFQDNGAKILQVLLLLDMAAIPGREGHDATDGEGRQYEMKSVNTALQDAVTTHHHLTLDLIEGYRPVEWIFALYNNIELEKVFILSPKDMEPWYQKWTWMLRQPNRTHINNPKVSIWFIILYGQLLYDTARDPPMVFRSLAEARAFREAEHHAEPTPVNMFAGEDGGGSDDDCGLRHLTRAPRPPPKLKAPRKKRKG
jgi:hypothetical protein